MYLQTNKIEITRRQNELARYERLNQSNSSTARRLRHEIKQLEYGRKLILY